MKFHLKIAIVAVIIFSFGITLNGETLELNLEKARQIALEKNPSVKLAREAVAKSKASVTEIRGNLLPTVSGFSSFQHSWELQKVVMPNFIKTMLGSAAPAGLPDYINVSFGMENSAVAGVNINQPLFMGGAIWNGYQISKLASSIIQSQYKVVEQKVLIDVTSAYYGLLFALSSVDVTEEGLQMSEKNLEQVNQFFTVGKASRFDVLRAEVQVANFKPMVVSAKNYAKLAESGLRMALGQNEQIDFIINDHLRFTASDLTEKNLDELIEIAERNRPEVYMMSRQKDIATRQLSLAKSAYMPSVIFGTSYQYQGQRNDYKFTNDDFLKSFNSSVTLSIPLFSGFKTSSKIQQAKIGIKEAGYQEESLLNGIRMEIKSAYFTLKQAQENVQTQEVTIKQAEEANRLAELMYTEGASTQLDVLNANVALNQAKMNYQKSLYEYNVALSSLKKAINEL
jgi:outer membrane protein TolC